MPSLTFPTDFLWGTATSAHQTEGANTNSDWWDFEHGAEGKCVESSGDACDSWHRWPEDLDLVSAMHLGAYRFSVEWARIEPAPGEWSRAALDHYRRMAAGCRERGLDPVVTLHHFASPRWVAADGGWENPAVVERFAAYCARTMEALGDEVTTVATMNEPNAMALVGWTLGHFPPGKTDPGLAWTVMENQRAAHRAAVASIRDVAPRAKVGLTLSMQDYQADPSGGEAAEQLAEGARAFLDNPFLDAVAGDDFLGIQVYTRVLFGAKGPIFPAGAESLQMGYEFWPEALEACLRRTWDYTGGAIPLVVTESGIGTADDAQRVEYVDRALRGVHACLADGLDIGGYFYWSLLDNFEWNDGFAKTFGLVAVDRRTFVRTPKASAQWYGEIARTRTLTTRE